MLWDLVEYPETSRVGSGLNININSPQKVAQFLSFASMTLVYVSIMTLVVEVRFCRKKSIFLKWIFALCRLFLKVTPMLETVEF